MQYVGLDIYIGLNEKWLAVKKIYFGLKDYVFMQEIYQIYKGKYMLDEL